MVTQQLPYWSATRPGVHTLAPGNTRNSIVFQADLAGRYAGKLLVATATELLRQPLFRDIAALGKQPPVVAVQDALAHGSRCAILQAHHGYALASGRPLTLFVP